MWILFLKKFIFYLFPFLHFTNLQWKHICVFRDGKSSECSLKHGKQSLAVALHPQKHSIIQESLAVGKLQFEQIFGSEYLSI